MQAPQLQRCDNSKEACLQLHLQETGLGAGNLLETCCTLPSGRTAPERLLHANTGTKEQTYEGEPSSPNRLPRGSRITARRLPRRRSGSPEAVRSVWAGPCREAGLGGGGGVSWRAEWSEDVEWSGSSRGGASSGRLSERRAHLAVMAGGRALRRVPLPEGLGAAGPPAPEPRRVSPSSTPAFLLSRPRPPSSAEGTNNRTQRLNARRLPIFGGGRL